MKKEQRSPASMQWETTCLCFSKAKRLTAEWLEQAPPNTPVRVSHSRAGSTANWCCTGGVQFVKNQENKDPMPHSLQLWSTGHVARTFAWLRLQDWHSVFLLHELGAILWASRYPPSELFRPRISYALGYFSVKCNSRPLKCFYEHAVFIKLFWKLFKLKKRKEKKKTQKTPQLSQLCCYISIIRLFKDIKMFKLLKFCFFLNIKRKTVPFCDYNIFSSVFCSKGINVHIIVSSCELSNSVIQFRFSECKS